MKTYYFIEQAPNDGSLIRYGKCTKDDAILPPFASIGRYNFEFAAIVTADLQIILPYDTCDYCWEYVEGNLNRASISPKQ
ncbi:hypothetical protein [Runella limosa]|uniref:hypothetical protein n=1 Tax=Runella limosa TaxID=370978 RepID=UPI00049128BF|nr:hypothetical protein [Runella limosa]